MSSYRGWGRRGGAEALWAITHIDYSADEGRAYRFNRRGRFFNGLHYPAPWSLSYQVVWSRGWRRWEVGWRFETIGYNDEHYGVTFHFLPLSVYLHLTTHGILPKPTQEREWKLVAMFSEGVARDISVHYQLGPGGINSPWKDRHGRRVGGVWSLLDCLLGRNEVTTTKGVAYDLDVPLPERSYRVRVTPTMREWKRPRWPHWPFTIRHASADIDSRADPLPVPDSGDHDWSTDDQDAIFGIGVPDGKPHEVATRLVAQVLKDRGRYGADPMAWRPTRDWRKPETAA